VISSAILGLGSGMKGCCERTSMFECGSLFGAFFKRINLQIQGNYDIIRRESVKGIKRRSRAIECLGEEVYSAE